MTLGMRLHTSVEEPEKVDAAQGLGSGLEPSQPLQPHEMVGGARGSDWDNVVAMDPDRLAGLYYDWRAGRVSSTQIQRDWGPSVLEALHLQHLEYMNGDLFYKACHRNGGVKDTCRDSEG